MPIAPHEGVDGSDYVPLTTKGRNMVTTITSKIDKALSEAQSPAAKVVLRDIKALQKSSDTMIGLLSACHKAECSKAVLDALHDNIVTVNHIVGLRLAAYTKAK